MLIFPGEFTYTSRTLILKGNMLSIFYPSLERLPHLYVLLVRRVVKTVISLIVRRLRG